MNQGNSNMLFPLLRSALWGRRAEAEKLNGYSSEMTEELVKVAAKHDVAHLLALGLKNNGLISKGERAEKYIFKAVYRYEKIHGECENLCNLLEKIQIPFLPLKGAVMRGYYPEGWMRTSCDIDILVHKEDSAKVAELLVNEHGYEHHGEGSHDISLISPNKVHVELHFCLIEEELEKSCASILEEVWDHSHLKAGFSYWYEMEDDMFYLYHIAHMAKHFENGGCGIRPFMDLWILDNLENINLEKRDQLLEKCGLLKFAKSCRKLSGVWFGGMPHDPISLQMEEYILEGGVYGTRKNFVAVQQQKKGGRLKYALSRIFLPYDVIKYYYPILHKHRWLTPCVEVFRWCKLIFCGHLKRSVQELQYNSAIDRSEAEQIKTFLNSIGL